MLRFASPSRLKNYSSAPIAGHQEILGRTSCLHAIRILFPLHVLLPSLKLLSTIHTWSVCLAGGNSGNPAGPFGLSRPAAQQTVPADTPPLAPIDCVSLLASHTASQPTPAAAAGCSSPARSCRLTGGAGGSSTLTVRPDNPILVRSRSLIETRPQPRNAPARRRPAGGGLRRRR